VFNKSNFVTQPVIAVGLKDISKLKYL